jgi:predicted nucleotidyltransferase
VRGAVLATLAQLAVPVSVRALAGHAGVSPQGALQVVNELAAAGIVIVTPAGRALMVSLNREHLAVEPILRLVGLRARLVERLTDELAGWSNLAGGWLFGSAARGDGDVNSDIDLLLVADYDLDENWESAAADLATQVQAWTGNPTQLVEHTRRSFTALVRRRNPLIAAVRAEGIPLTPTSPELLRGAA